jgi:hypothetical protein
LVVVFGPIYNSFFAQDRNGMVYEEMPAELKTILAAGTKMKHLTLGVAGTCYYVTENGQIGYNFGSCYGNLNEQVVTGQKMEIPMTVSSAFDVLN